MDTVEFSLRKSKSIVEYLPTKSSELCTPSSLDTGHILTFCFVLGYGTRSTFGKDKNIFY